MTDHSAVTSGHDAPNAVATTAVTVDQAAAILGISITTVKRRIKSGALQSEQAQRPQGTVWLVYLPTAAMPAAEERPSAASVAATAPTTTPQAEALASLVQATVAAVLGPLVAELGASRQTNERQADQLVQQAETIGSLRMENATLKAAQAQQEARTAVEPAPAPVEPTVPVWRRWWLAALVLVGILMLTGVLAWLR